ncbi:MAG: PfkB family carbohydrate kinase [Salinivirgaceae bacterium]|jgi:sugar/nucleoside kinase (ribokinase family)|nr:PfkB family carbohydrate kinase [Salinivirgaceae bacterium]
MDLIALTTCCVDYYPQLDKSFMGGNTLNLASTWKKTAPTANISVITCLGKDKNGETISNFLNKIGIKTSRVYTKEGTTACNQLRVDEHGERFGIEGTWNGGVYEDFLLSEKDWAFVATQDIVAIPANNPNYSEMVKRKTNGQILSVDFMDVENNMPIEDTIAKTDIAFVAARTELINKYEMLANKTSKLLVITSGADGSYAFFNGNKYHQPAIEVHKVVDTTGCGDAYQGAFALTYYNTNDIQESMKAGAIAASDILQHYGGVGKID